MSTVEAMVGSALKIKPILSVDEEGKLVIRSKARGTNKAMEYLIAKTVEEGGDLSTLRAVIGHADCIEKAEKLKQMAVDAGYAGGQSDDCANWTDHWYACRFWYVSDCICNKYVTNY